MSEAPKVGTPEYEWWAKGATAEHNLIVEGMNQSGKEAYDCVKSLAQQGSDRDDIIDWLVHVFKGEKKVTELPTYIAYKQPEGAVFHTPGIQHVLLLQLHGDNTYEAVGVFQLPHRELAGRVADLLNEKGDNTV